MNGKQQVDKFTRAAAVPELKASANARLTKLEADYTGLRQRLEIVEEFMRRAS